MLIKNPKKAVITDYTIAQIIGKTDKKEKEFVDIGNDGQCHVYRILPGPHKINMAVRVWSPTTDWGDGGPVFEKYRGKIAQHLRQEFTADHVDSAYSMYKLADYMRIVCALHVDDVPDHPTIELLFGSDWLNNKELF